MSDTCIVCLGDLSLGDDDATAQSTTGAKSPLADQNADEHKPTITNEDFSELIAHIQPCGHDLHNACLKPWVERANSCPICRATFNIVELKHHVGGKVVSSYLVEDRTQVAELDPSLFLEIPNDEDDDEPCQACGESDNEDVLMYCDGCDKLWHTYCVDLQEVPRGAWYCRNCRASRGTRPPGRRGGASRRRTRGQQRRMRGQHLSHDTDWNDLWQLVFIGLGMDLDFPHEEDDASANAMRRHRQTVQADRISRRAWISRVRVAEMAGVGNFREHEAAIFNGNSRRVRASPHPYVETPEETDAWNAFEEARAPSAGPSSKRRKRKSMSRTSSPAEPQESGPLQVKRRRVCSSEDADISSRSAELPRPLPARVSPVSRPVPAVDGAAAPSFLQSLLQEVEDSSSTGSRFHTLRPTPRGAGSPAGDHSSPRPSSPAISPAPSNHSSPRAMSATPPPPSHIRPTSPTGLSSSIQPVFPSTEYSPLRISPEPQEQDPESPPARGTNTIAQPKPERRSRVPQQALSSRQPRSHGPSPTRQSMSLMAKSDVQKLVSAALKPHYNEQKISKDEYTMINRDISRMLYEKIGDFESLDLNGKAKWEKVAGEEVDRAIGALRAQA